MAAEQPQTTILREFRTIPGVGKAVALDLWNLGLRSVADLRGRDPEVLYTQLCDLAGMHVDRCMLYTVTKKTHYPDSKLPRARIPAPAKAGNPRKGSRR